MLLNSVWHPPWCEMGCLRVGLFLLRFGDNINLEEHSYPIELFEQKTTVNNFCFCLLSNKVVLFLFIFKVELSSWLIHRGSGDSCLGFQLPCLFHSLGSCL
jgi:hypothetical protein